MDSTPERQPADDVMLGLCFKAIAQGWTVRQRSSGTWAFEKGTAYITSPAAQPGQFTALYRALEIAGFDARRESGHGKLMSGLIAEALDQGWSVRRSGPAPGKYSFKQSGSQPVTGSGNGFDGYRDLTEQLTAGGLRLESGTLTVRIGDPDRSRPAARRRKSSGPQGRGLS